MVSINDVLKASKGLPVDDIFAELWGRKLSSDYTIATYTGTLPAVLAGTKAGYLHRYKIYGNTEQASGTPTPENPIVPSECGERTDNLFDESNFSLLQVTATAYRYGTSLGVLPQGTYVFNATKLSGAQSIYLTAKLNDIYSQTTISSVPFSFTADGNSEYIIRTANNTGTTWEAEKYSNMMLTEGSTAPTSYIPYGYKLPLLSGSTPVDIYLGESQTTRQIRKLVLTGEEDLYSVTEATSGTAGLYAFVYRYDAIGMSDILNYNKHMASILYPVFLSSHFKMKTSDEYTSYKNIKDGEMGANSNTGGLNIFFVLCKSGITTAEDFKTYLAQQYANGTPVTVWYVLATEQTGTLNEPLRKIGDYADTIDSTQTSAQIPTTANSTTISWGGQGLEPSEVEFEYERV